MKFIMRMFGVGRAGHVDIVVTASLHSVRQAPNSLEEAEAGKTSAEARIRALEKEIADIEHVITTVRKLPNCRIAKDARNQNLVEPIDISTLDNSEHKFRWDTWPVKELDSGKLYVARVRDLHPMSSLEALGDAAE